MHQCTISTTKTMEIEMNEITSWIKFPFLRPYGGDGVEVTFEKVDDHNTGCVKIIKTFFQSSVAASHDILQNKILDIAFTTYLLSAHKF